MADLALLDVSPWAGLWRRGRFGHALGEPGLDIAESDRGSTALLSARRGRAPDLARAAQDLGLTLPGPRAWTQDRGFVVLSTAPDQWLVRGPRPFSELAAGLEPLAPFATVIDQSHARAVLTLSGLRLRDALAKGFEIDLHPRAFRPGDVAVTVVAGVSAIVWQIDERPTFEVAVPRSMAGSFWHWLSESAAEYGYRVSTREA